MKNIQKAGLILCIITLVMGAAWGAAFQANAGKAGWRTRWFQELYALIGPERAVFEPNPDVRWEDARANGAR